MKVIHEVLTIRSQFEWINVFVLFVLTVMWLLNDYIIHAPQLSLLAGVGAIASFAIQTLLDLQKLRRLQMKNESNT